MLLGQGSSSLGHGQLPPQKLFCVWLCHDWWFLKMMKDWKQPYYEFPLAHSSQLLKWNLAKSRIIFITRLAWNWSWIILVSQSPPTWPGCSRSSFILVGLFLGQPCSSRELLHAHHCSTKKLNKEEEYYYYEDKTRLGIARNLRWRS
jgi:hypothetical protein